MTSTSRRNRLSFYLRQLLTDEEKLSDYLDYLHAQSVKSKNPPRLSLDAVKNALDLE